MNVYFLALRFRDIGTACEGSSAERICLEPSPPRIAQLEFASSPDDALCDSCFSKVNENFSRIGISLDSNFRGIYQYLKTLNDNHKCYKLAKDEKYNDAIEVLLGAGQKTLFASIYDLNFESEGEMKLFKGFLRANLYSLDHHCGLPIKKAVSLYLEVMWQVFGDGKFFMPNARSANFKKKHAYYYDKYRSYVNSRRSDGKIPAGLPKLIQKVKINSKASNLDSKISCHFYDALLSKLPKLGHLTDKIVYESLSPFVYKAKGNRFPLDVVSFQPVYAFIGYKAEDEQYKAKIESILRAMLLDRRRLAMESIYNLLKMYKTYRSLSFPLFTDYTILVHTIIFEHSAFIRSDEERGIFLNLHCNLAVYILPFYCQQPLSRESLVCFEKLKTNIPVLSDAIDTLEVYCIREMCESAGAQLVALLYDFWKARDPPRMAYFFRKIRLTSEHLPSLLRAIAVWRVEISIKVSILCELAKCDVFSEVSHGCISKHLSNDNSDLIVVYSLAMVSYIYKAKKARNAVKEGTLEMYLRLHSSYPSIFTYSDGPHSAEYYILHAYDIFLNQHYPCNEELQTLWRDCIFPNYQLSFFTSLWSGLDGTLSDPERDLTDCGELAEMKRWAFRTIKCYSQVNQNPNALTKPVYELFASKVSLSDVYIHYFQSDPGYKNYLIIKYFLYCSEIRGRIFGFEIDYEYVVLCRARVVEHLETLANSFLCMSRTGTSLARLKSAIHRACETIYRWGVIHVVEEDEGLRELSEAMILQISCALLNNRAIKSNEALKELSFMQIFSLTID